MYFDIYCLLFFGKKKNKLEFPYLCLESYPSSIGTLVV